MSLDNTAYLIENNKGVKFTISLSLLISNGGVCCSPEVGTLQLSSVLQQLWQTGLYSLNLEISAASW